MSGLGDAALVERCRRAGYRLFLMKPLTFEQVIDAVRAVDIRPGAPPVSSYAIATPPAATHLPRRPSDAARRGAGAAAGGINGAPFALHGRDCPGSLAAHMGEEDPMRRLRHDLRNAFNELRLCVEVLPSRTIPPKSPAGSS